MNSKKLVWILVLLAVLALLFFLKPGKKGEAPKKNMGPPAPVPVKAILMKGRTLHNRIRATGSLLADEEVNLQPEVPGKIMKIYFEEGKNVRKGQLLLQLNDAELRAQLPKAESKLRMTKEMEQRQKNLLGKEGISQSEYDISLNELRASEAEVEQLKEMLRKTTITAPFDGTIGLKYVSEGAYVTPGMRIASLRNISRIKIEFAIPEKYVSGVHIGTSISFTTESSVKEYQAQIYAIEPGIDPISRNVVLRAICPNDGSLFPGSFATVSVPLDDMKNAMMIPSEVIVPVLKGQKVFLASGDSVREQKIETGTRTDTEVQVTKGLQEGDTLITSAIMQLKQGSKIKVKLIP